MTISSTQVFFFIPNLIGYSRILACGLSYYYAFSDPALCMLLYFVGAGMDAIDGVAARHFDQCSKLGWLLDMLTDRMGTAVLFIILSHMYPAQWGFFAFLVVLDTVSHWFQMITTLLQGKATHKGSDTNALLNFYYNFPYALLVCCCGNELFVMTLYMQAHWAHPALTYTAWACFPVFVFKQFMNFVQLYDAAGKLTAIDAAEYNAKRAKKEDGSSAGAASGPRIVVTAASGKSAASSRKLDRAGGAGDHGHNCSGHGHSH